jgi:hypothetical protein
MRTVGRRYRFACTLGAVVLLGVAGSGLVHAAGAVPVADPSVHTCYPSNSQSLRALFVTPTGVCPSGFIALDISQRGPQGPQGPQGVQGPIGPAGPQGPAGPTGATGATVATGATGPQGPACPATNPACKGPKGDPGPAGVSGYEVVFSGDVVFQAFETKDMFVPCPSGKTAISGGWGILGGQSAVVLIGSVPSGNLVGLPRRQRGRGQPVRPGLGGVRLRLVRSGLAAGRSATSRSGSRAP